MNEYTSTTAILNWELTKRVVQRALKDTDVYKLDIKNEVLNINYMLPKILEAMDEQL